jgi:hypothetical protein
MDFAFLPNEHILLARRNGEIQILDYRNAVNNGFGLYLDITSRTDFTSERGVQSIALDPDFTVSPSSRWVYVYYVANLGATRNQRLSRWLHTPSTFTTSVSLSAAAEQVLWTSPINLIPSELLVDVVG